MTTKLAGTKFRLSDEFTVSGESVISVSDSAISTALFTQAGTGAQARSVESKLRETVSVRDFGAVGDGVTDDTAAIQAAVNAVSAAGRGEVYFPAGTYKTTATVTISSSNVSLVGAGIGVSFIYPAQSSGDVIYFSGTTGTPLQRVGMRELSMYGQATNPTSGALVRMSNVNTVAGFINVELAAYFGALLLESVVHGTFHGIDLKSDANFTSRRTDSYLLKISQASGGALPAELHFYGSEWRGMNGNNHLDYAVWIEAADGIWFNGGHIGFVGQHGMMLKPAATNTQLTAVNVRNMYIDTCGESALEIVEPGSYAGVFGAHDIDITQIYNCARGIRHNCATTDSSRFEVGQAIEITNGAIRIIKGSNITARLHGAWQINKVAGTAGGIHVSGAGTGYLLYAAVEKKGAATPYFAIWIDGTVDQVLIEGGRSLDCTFDILRADTAGANVQIGPWVTNRSNSINATAGGDIPLVLSQNVFMFGTAYAGGIISDQYAANGRIVTLIATGAVDVYDSNNLKLASTFSMTADDSLTLRCQGGNWYEMSRSAN